MAMLRAWKQALAKGGDQAYPDHMRYDLVEGDRGCWPVRLMDRTLSVSPGGYDEE